MGTYTGTSASDVIVPGFTSPGVVENPAATTPSGAADTLNGGAGADFMDGGDGSDTYFVDNVGDITVERFNDLLGGVDNVFASASHTIGFGIENLFLTGVGDIDGTGNANANTLSGNAGNNVLSGLGGNDVLFGNGGDDELRGGVGADAMLGGTGNDSYFVDNAGDTVNEAANQGIDTVNTLISLTLSANVENLILAGAADLDGTGNALDNVLTGNAGSNQLTGLGGDDILDGGAGADDMNGGEASDTYFVDDVGDTVTDNAGDPGIDEVNSTISFNLGAGIENLILLGSDNLDGFGNALANAIFGNDGDNDLLGRGGTDELHGNQGEDDLDGGVGNDELFGGGKSDDLFGGKGRDVMSGEQGADDFVYTKTNQSGTSNATRDRILDFKGQDDIVLTGIDAVQGQPGNQDFSLDQNGNFEAGEIRLREVNAGVIIDLNVDGDGAAEMSILLKDYTGPLNNSDFDF